MESVLGARTPFHKLLHGPVLQIDYVPVKQVAQYKQRGWMKHFASAGGLNHLFEPRPGAHQWQKTKRQPGDPAQTEHDISFRATVGEGLAEMQPSHGPAGLLPMGISRSSRREKDDHLAVLRRAGIRIHQGLQRALISPFIRYSILAVHISSVKPQYIVVYPIDITFKDESLPFLFSWRRSGKTKPGWKYKYY